MTYIYVFFVKSKYFNIWLVGFALCFAIVFIVAIWLTLGKSREASKAIVQAPITTAPSHEIPASAQKNMVNAEATRIQTLNALISTRSALVYAKVIDQSGQPVSHAKVLVESAMGIRMSNDSLQETSDSDGSLSFARKWPVLSITVTKAGYQRLLASSATFQYAKTMFTPPAKPDPGNPVLFILQKADK